MSETTQDKTLTWLCMATLWKYWLHPTASLDYFISWSQFYKTITEESDKVKLDKKNPCWAVFSVTFKMVDTTNTYVLPTRLVSVQTSDAHEAFCCYATYRIVYHIMTTVSGYVSYRGKMYCCRPRHDTIDWFTSWTKPFVITSDSGFETDL